MSALKKTLCATVLIKTINTSECILQRILIHDINYFHRMRYVTIMTNLIT